MKAEEKVVRSTDDLADKLDYYERLLDYLDDMVPCLSDLIEQFDENEE